MRGLPGTTIGEVDEALLGVGGEGFMQRSDLSAPNMRPSTVIGLATYN
jgi:hypothetical protein